MAEYQGLAERMLKPVNETVGIRCYTAHVSGRIDPGGDRDAQPAAFITVMHSPRFLAGFAERFAAELTAIESNPTVI